MKATDLESVGAESRPASWRSLVLDHPLVFAAPLAAAVTWALLSLLVPQ